MKRLTQTLLTVMLSASVAFAEEPVRTEIHSGWEFRQARLTNWYPATVPGTVHTDLMENGIIEDPYYRLNERGVQWIDKEDWVYRTVFDVDDVMFSRSNVRLTFYGLDTYTDVYLNGEQVLHTDNMFREWQCDVRPLLRQSGNELMIYFHSPVKKALPLYEALPYHYEAWNDQAANGGLISKKLSPFTRKAGYHYGWDWGPRLVTSGIWRKVELEGWDDLRIENIQVLQHDVSIKSAKLEFAVEIEASRTIENAEVVIRDKGTGREYASRSMDLQEGKNMAHLTFTVREPRLWWCNGMGNPEMYSFATSISSDGLVRDTRTENIGIRSIEVEKTPDKYGRSLRFVLNGEPVFCKGANYIPCDNFLPRVTDETYRKTIQDAADVNMNMLRVWGGGIYEDDRFYELCDSLGIMVWQDFMFACAVYPAKGDFLENIRQEAICNVKRLRNHPCIVYWCGNNENQDSWLGGWIYDVNKVDPKYSEVIWHEYEQQYYMTLAEVVKEYGSGIGYQPTSPFADYGVQSNDHDGDRHYWEVWHGKKPISEYNNQRSRFFSEYGFQSFPSYDAVMRFAPEKRDHNIRSEVLMSHQRGGEHANSLIEAYLLNEYHTPKDFKSFLYASQILQGDAIKTAIEAHRRDKGYCWGSLYWQHNDCWPAASWSSRDWYGNWKALHYFARKAFDNVLVSPIEKYNSLEIHTVSDLPKDVSGTLSVKSMLMNGTVILEISKKIRIKANSDNISIAIPTRHLYNGHERKDIIVSASVTVEGKTYSNIHFPCIQKEMNYLPVTIQYEIKQCSSGYNLILQSDCFARGVYLHTDTSERKTPHTPVFSDNFFNLMPGEPYEVHVDTTLSKDTLKAILQITTLRDSYK